MPWFYVLGHCGLTRQEFDESTMVTAGILFVLSIFSGMGFFNPFPVRIWIFLFRHDDWKYDREYRKKEKVIDADHLQFLFKIRAHCRKLRKDVMEHLPFLPEGYFDQDILEELAKIIENPDNKNLSLNQPLKKTAKVWKRRAWRSIIRYNKAEIHRIERDHFSDHFHPERQDPGPVPKYRNVEFRREPPAPTLEEMYPEDDYSWIVDDDHYYISGKCPLDE